MKSQIKLPEIAVVNKKMIYIGKTIESVIPEWIDSKLVYMKIYRLDNLSIIKATDAGVNTIFIYINWNDKEVSKYIKILFKIIGLFKKNDINCEIIVAKQVYTKDQIISEYSKILENSLDGLLKISNLHQIKQLKSLKQNIKYTFYSSKNN